MLGVSAKKRMKKDGMMLGSDMIGGGGWGMKEGKKQNLPCFASKERGWAGCE
jgi:hypothetical protein